MVTEQCKQIVILLVRSSHLGWIGLRTMLRKQGKLWTVTEVETPGDALTITTHEHPDVIIITTDLPDNVVTNLAQNLHMCSPSTHLILLGDELTVARHYTCAQKGIEAYLDWNMFTPATIYSILTVVIQGQGEVIVVSRALFDHAFANRHAPDEGKLFPLLSTTEPVSHSLSTLSGRERQVLSLIASGAHYKQVARRLNLAANTVKSHMAHIRERWEVRTSDEAIAVYRSLTNNLPTTN